MARNRADAHEIQMRLNGNREIRKEPIEALAYDVSRNTGDPPGSAPSAGAFLGGAVRPRADVPHPRCDLPEGSSPASTLGYSGAYQRCIYDICTALAAKEVPCVRWAQPPSGMQPPTHNGDPTFISRVNTSPERKTT